MTYAEFWHRYLRAHADPRTRTLHLVGTAFALVCVLCAAIFRDWYWLIAAPVVGYGLAWAAHAGIEHNRPETFGHPLWSLASDLRMAALLLCGRLAPHLRRAGLP
jgi:hypothetical protein